MKEDYISSLKRIAIDDYKNNSLSRVSNEISLALGFLAGPIQAREILKIAQEEAINEVHEEFINQEW